VWSTRHSLGTWSWLLAAIILSWIFVLVAGRVFSGHLSRLLTRWRRAPRVLLVLGWLLLVVGGVALLGHVVRPTTASDPVLGKFGGWILDAMSLTFGVGTLLLRKRLLTERVDS
jgi:hypothetical protein